MMGFLGLVLVLSVLAVSMAMPAMADDQAHALEMPPRSSAHAEIYGIKTSDAITPGSQMQGFLNSFGGVVRVVIKSDDQTLYDEMRRDHAMFIKIPGESLTIDVFNYNADSVAVKYSILAGGEEVYLEIQR